MRRRKYLRTLGVTAGITASAGCTDTTDGDGQQAVDDDGTPDDNTETGADNDSDSEDAATDTDGESGDDGADTDEGDKETEVAIGELVEGDSMHLVVEDFERGVDFGEFTEPDEGNEFASVTVALKNVSEGFVGVSNLLQTRIHDDENYSYEQTFVGGDEPTFNDGQFAPGEVERGAINFEIPEDATGLELVWDFDIGLFSGLERAVVDLETEGDVHRLEQDLRIDVHDVGTTVEFEDTGVTVNEMRTEDSLGTLTEPDEGNEYVVVDISVENGTDEEQRISTILQMLAKDGEGWSYQEDLMATSSLDRAFDESSPIASGETRRGEVVYQVEEGLSPLYWVFEFSLWVDGDKTFWQLR